MIDIKDVLTKHKAWAVGASGGVKADLHGADLRLADLHEADLRRADLHGANLRRADLHEADLHEANLLGANLLGANFSGCKGLGQALPEGLVLGAEGLRAYKTFNVERSAPSRWVLEPGAVITEVVNPCPTNDCGCGINIAPLAWVRASYPGHPVWEVLVPIDALHTIVVPYGTDGKVRCGKAMLVRLVPEDES